MSRNEELAQGYHSGRTYQADLESVTAQVAAAYNNNEYGNNPEHGMSLYVHGGELARTGYAVGGSEKVPEVTVHDSTTLSPNQVQRHRNRVRSKTTSHDAVAGAWVENGNTVLDASEVVPDRDRAKRLQADRGERAVWNLKKGKEEDLR